MSAYNLIKGSPDPDTFIGATIRLYQADLLLVYVPASVLGDRAQAPTIVAAFQERFRRTVVLVAQDRRGVPTYFGPAPIAAVLARIPFDALAWRRYRYRKPQQMMLPIPTYPLPEDRDTGDASGSEDSDAFDSSESADSDDSRDSGAFPTLDAGATRPGKRPPESSPARPPERPVEGPYQKALQTELAKLRRTRTLIQDRKAGDPRR